MIAPYRVFDFQVFDEKWEVLWKLTYGGSQ